MEVISGIGIGIGLAWGVAWIELLAVYDIESSCTVYAGG